MPRSMHDLGINRLSVEDRLALAQEIWDSVAQDLERETLTTAQRQELERRLADRIARPEAVTPWEVVKARVLARATMSLPVVLREEAQAEFDEAFDFHEGQRPGLGVTFATRVQEVFDRIGSNPTLRAVVFADIRKAAVARFPCRVDSRAEATQVQVIAVLHTARDPAIWQGRA